MLRMKHKSTWLSWELIDGLKMASEILAIASLIFSIIAIIKGPKWLAFSSLLVSLLACSTIPIVT